MLLRPVGPARPYLRSHAGLPIPKPAARRIVNSPLVQCCAQQRLGCLQRAGQAAATVVLTSVLLVGGPTPDAHAALHPPAALVTASAQRARAHAAYVKEQRAASGHLQPDGSVAAHAAGGAAARPAGHKPLWPLDLRDAAAFSATAAALVLAASSGVGGGSLLIMIYMLVFGFSTGPAVALSNVTILGGSLMNFAFNVGRRHPRKPEPLVDWDLILIMEPSTILGAIAGGYINHVLPPWLTTAILSPLLGFITANTLKKGILTYRGETRRLNMMRHSALDCTSEAAPGPGSDGGSGGGGYGGEGVGPRMQAVQTPQSYAYGMQSAGEPFPLALPSPSSHPLDIASEPLVRPYSSGSSGSSSTAGQLPPAAAAAAPPPKASLGEDTDRCWKPEVPAAKVGILVALLAGVVASDFARSTLPCPSMSYWVAAASMVPVTLVVLWGVREYLMKQQCQRTATAQAATSAELAQCSIFSSSPEERAACEQAVAERAAAAKEGQLEWDGRSTVIYPLLCTGAGLAAGMFGVGGGIIKAPLMVEMGVEPQVAAATSATMILFTSASASVIFMSFGQVQWDYGLALFSLALAATAVGHLATKRIIESSGGRSSVIVFVMAAVLGVSAVVLGVEGLTAGLAAFEQHRAWEWGSMCSEGPR